MSVFFSCRPSPIDRGLRGFAKERGNGSLSLSLLPYPPPVPFISIVRFSRFSRECRERASTVRRREGAGGGSSRERDEEAFGQRGTEEVKPTPEQKSKRGKNKRAAPHSFAFRRRLTTLFLALLFVPDQSPLHALSTERDGSLNASSYHLKLLARKVAISDGRRHFVCSFCLVRWVLVFRSLALCALNAVAVPVRPALSVPTRERKRREREKEARGRASSLVECSQRRVELERKNGRALKTFFFFDPD